MNQFNIEIGQLRKTKKGSNTLITKNPILILSQLTNKNYYSCLFKDEIYTIYYGTLVTETELLSE